LSSDQEIAAIQELITQYKHERSTLLIGDAGILSINQNIELMYKQVESLQRQIESQQRQIESQQRQVINQIESQQRQAINQRIIDNNGNGSSGISYIFRNFVVK
jgi:ABC-type cobalamin transport system ATPase subunit